MKCLIIAAGKGHRLKYRDRAKPLVPLLGVPLIERIIRSAKQAGINDFIVVTGYKGEKVRQFLDLLVPRLRISMTHLVNEEWDKGNGLSVLKAKEYLKKESFLLLMADNLFESEIVSHLLAEGPDRVGVTLVVDFNTSNPLVDINDVTRVMVSNGKVLDIGKGLREFNSFDTGIFYCTPSIFRALEISLEEGETTLSAGIRRLAQEGKVDAFDVCGRYWIDVDDRRAMKRAEKILLKQSMTKPNDGPVSRFLNRPLSAGISRYLVRTRATPSQISFLTFLLSMMAAWLFSRNGYGMLAAGAVLAQFASIVDGCDGEVARLKFHESDFGKWFDAVLDRYADAFLLLGLSWHAFSLHHNRMAFFVGFLAIIGSFLLSYTADKYDSLMKQKCEKGARLRIGRDVRIFIIFLGALFNVPLLTLFLIAVLMNVETFRRVLVCRHG